MASEAQQASPTFSEAFCSLANASHYRTWCSMLITILLKLHAATSASNCASAVDQLIREEHQPDTTSPTDQIVIR